MTLIYTCIAQNKQIIAEAVPPSVEKNAEECLRMSQECEQVLERLFQNHQNQNFIVYSTSSQSFFCLLNYPMTYIVVSGSTLSKAQGQQFLNDIKQFFTDIYDIKQTLPNLTQKTKIQLQQLMAEFQLQVSTDPGKFDTIKTDITQAKDKLSECVELLLLRGEKLNTLYEEVDELKELTLIFKRSSGDLEKAFCRRNYKYFIISGIAGVAIIVIIALMIALM